MHLLLLLLLRGSLKMCVCVCAKENRIKPVLWIRNSSAGAGVPGAAVSRSPLRERPALNSGINPR